jgi:mannan endo-1,4-beta-mannosidase
MSRPWPSRRRHWRSASSRRGDASLRFRSVGSHRREQRPRLRRLSARSLIVISVAAVVAAVASFLAVTAESSPGRPAGLSTEADSYVGVYVTGIPHSYGPIREFVAKTGVRPNLLLYYSAWWEPFRSQFAAAAARHHAVPLVQINPEHVRLADIAAGRYDKYVTDFALSIRGYHDPVIVGFGHEMNAQWSKWGYRHARPTAFVAAWRHVVDVFRMVRVPNVTWLWTINVIDAHAHSLPPRAWWPGRRYVDWVGIDGYYRRPTWRFAALFGPTIKAVRAFTRDPILISETGVAPRAGKAEKIGNLFAGVRSYGLLGLVWFDAVAHQDWRIDSPAAIEAFHRAARTTSAGQ